MPEPISPPASPHYVPYQAYKPKRHSRNFSSASGAGSRPSSTVVSPAASPLPRLHPDEDKDPVPTISLVGSYGTSSSPSFAGRYMDSLSQPQEGTPAIRVETVETPLSTPDPAETIPVLSPNNFYNSPEDTRPKSANVVAFPNAGSPSMPPSPSSSSHPQSPPPNLSPVPRKVSTFRRLTPRPSAPSSPLAAPQQVPPSHSRSVSTASSPAQQAIEPRHTAPPKAPSPTDRFRTSSVPNAFSPSPRVVEQDLPPIPRASATPPEHLHATHSQTSTSNLSVSTSQSSSRQNGVITLNEGRPTSSSSFQKSKSASAPYRPGFQPKGVYRPLTDDFLALRRSKRDGEGDIGRMKRIEKTKLERRLEKLINLHFPAPGSEEEKTAPLRPKLQELRSVNRRASSFFDFDSMKNRKIADAGDLWRGVILGSQDKAREIRASEQRITPWEEDNTVTKCPLCQASFHPLTCRKHHCRLCGKIICALPPKMPQRPATCSLLFVVDSKTGQIEEVGEGVDYGVKRKKNNTRQEDEDKFLHGVRICRDCRPVLARQQYLRQAEDYPTFVKLYNVLIPLEQEIEESLPQFQEILMTLNQNDQPTKEAVAARRRLLDAFGQYDKLSKQIRATPCPTGPGSSQDRVQTAILTRASIFLQKNMVPLQYLPKPSTSKAPPLNGSPAKATEDNVIDRDSDLARALQPLLEQETLLESFIEEAKAQRKFEDVKTLKSNYAEIRREIENVLNGSGIQDSP